MTRIVPVLDVMNGVAVRAVGGRREEYEPLRSKLVDSTDPVIVAAAMLAATGAKELYLADLDAIRGGPRNQFSINATVWLDAGWRTTHIQLPSNLVPVFSLESLVPLALDPWPAGAIFSIDLKAGILNGDCRAWKLKDDRDAIGLATTLHKHGVRRMIVLDVASVGEGRGVPTLEVCRGIREALPEVEIITGGGVRTMADVQIPWADVVLVASAIHTGEFNSDSSRLGLRLGRHNPRA